MDRRPPDCWLPDLCGPSIAILRLLLFGVLLSFILVILRSGFAGFDWGLLGQTSLLVIWILMLTSFGLCFLRRRIIDLSIPIGVIAALVWVLLVTLVSTALLDWLTPIQPESDRSPLMISLLENSIVALIIAGVFFRYFYIGYELRVRERAANQARIDLLQARIEPHFLFNSMNTIVTLISEDPEAAEEAALDLSDLFRAALRQQDEVSTLGQELELVKKYLSIEKLRMGDRLDWQFDIDSSLLTQKLPCLTLQPIVENAVLHGIHPLQRGGAIKLATRLADNLVEIEILNPCGNGDSVSPSGERMGMTNIVARLRDFFDEDLVVSHGVRDGVVDGRDGSEYQTLIRFPKEGGKI